METYTLGESSKIEQRPRSVSVGSFGQGGVGSIPTVSVVLNTVRWAV